MSILLDGLNGITSPSGTVVSLTTTGNTIIGDATTDTLNVGAGGLVKDASGNVGIGTATTTNAKVTVNANTVLPATAPPTGTNLWVTGADAAVSRITLDSFGSSGNFTFRSANGTAAVPTATLANVIIGTIASIGYGATAYPTTSRASLVFIAAENWTDTAQGSYQVFNTTAIGSTTQAEQMRIDSAGLLKFNSGYGSAATAYGCRAWVNFNGTGTVAIRASGNVSSITDNGTGDYTVNFTTAMPNANYAFTFGSGDGWRVYGPVDATVVTVSTFRFTIRLPSTAANNDVDTVSVAFFR